MPVVINEFEVVTEPGPQPAGAAAPPPDSAPPAAPLTVQQVEQAIRHASERRARVRAD